MPLFQRRNGKNKDLRDLTGDTQDVTQNTVNPELTEQVQDVMKDNLELMKEVVFRIRDDPEFAKGIYKDCPRLQHLLDQYPDLRPIFEDPKLVRINFEEVYRAAGGILPEDEEKKKSWLVWLVNSPFFKVLKLLLFVKKLVAFITGGGFAFLSGCLMGCCFEDSLDELDVDDADADDDGDLDMDPNKEALNRAADHMEDPEVQEQMQRLLEDPDNLQDAIENDDELRALRDSNPLCQELMSDPDTMRILTDPDNLRALGEAPSLIEADFIDPDSFMPTDIETGGFDGLDGGYDVFDGGDVGVDYDVDVDGDFDVEVDGDDGFDGGDDFGDEADVDADADADADAEGEDEAGEEGEEDQQEEEEDDGGWWEDAEFEEQDQPDMDVDADADGGQGGGPDGGQDGGQDGNAQGKGQAKGQARSQPKTRQQNAPPEGQGRFGGIMASIGVAATDLIAAQIVGSVFSSDMIPDLGGLGGGGGGGGGEISGLGGGGDPLGGNVIEEIADDAGEVINDDVADVAEETMDEVDEKADEKAEGKDGADGLDVDDVDDDGKKTGAAAGGAAGGAVAVGGAGAVATRSGDKGEVAEDAGDDNFNDEEEVKKPKKKNRFRMVGNLVSAISTAAKEQIATSILGDDWGEALVERMEEGGDDEDDDKKKADDKKKDGEEDEDEEKKPKSLRNLFRRKKEE